MIGRVPNLTQPLLTSGRQGHTSERLRRLLVAGRDNPNSLHLPPIPLPQGPPSTTSTLTLTLLTCLPRLKSTHHSLNRTRKKLFQETSGSAVINVVDLEEGAVIHVLG